MEKKFYSLNLESIEEEIKKGNQIPLTKDTSVPITSLKEGENIIRFLPPIHPDGKIFRKLAIHWFGSRSERQGLICLKPFGKKCYICSLLQKFLASGVDYQKLSPYFAKTRIFANAINMKHPEEGVKVYSLPAQKVVQELIEIAKYQEIGDFTDLKNGYNVIVVMKRDGMFPDYKVFFDKRPSELNTRYIDKVYDIFDNSFWNILTYEKMKEIWDIYTDLTIVNDDLDIDEKNDLPINDTDNLSKDGFNLDEEKEDNEKLDLNLDF